MIDSDPEFGEAGKRLWQAVLDEFELGEHELAILRQAASVADSCDRLQLVVDSEGELTYVRGEVRAHPALIELRQQRILLARLVVALRVPLGEQEQDDSSKRTQRRALRGVYGIKGGMA